MGLTIIEMKNTTSELSVFASGDDSMDSIAEAVCAGGTLPEWCAAHQVRFGVVAAWINSDKHRLEAYAQATAMRGEWFEQAIFKELRGIMTLDVRDLLTDDGELKPVSEWPEATARAVSGIEVDNLVGDDGKFEGTKHKVKLADKLKAIEMMMKHRRMMVDKVEHSGKLTLEALVEESRLTIDEATPHPGVSHSPAL